MSLALAVHFFGPVTAAMLAANPLLQAPAMAWIYRLTLCRGKEPAGEGEGRQGMTGG